VAYTPVWEPLADALKRVMATGISEDEAKIDLCRAVADRKIDLRVRIAASDDAMRGRVFSDGNVGVPPHLAPRELDWVQSRPLNPWWIGPMRGQHYSWLSGENRPIDLIEISVADVGSIFGSPQPESRSVAITRDETAAAKLVRDILKENPHVARQAAFDKCREKYPALTERGFLQRVWPNGRKLANLSPLAPKGRKRKT
jgi:hypothetical protein